MTHRIGFVIDPLLSLNPKKDATLAMMKAAEERGWQMHYFEQSQMFIANSRPQCRAQRIHSIDYEASPFAHTENSEILYLGDFDAIFMRKDPPFDMEYIYATYMLEKAELEGTLIVNKPSSLRDCNEKLFATQFPQCCPPLVVSSQADVLRAFVEAQQDAILKPLDGMGGTSIFRVKAGDSNMSVIIETLTNYGKTPAMGQRFLPEISQGDKRILMIDGQAVPYSLARVPLSGESRGNLAAGGQGVAQPLTDRDKWIAAEVGPSLVEKGIIFAGLDVIGDYLTEINVTSPTCIREIDKAFDTKIGEHLMTAVANRLGQ